MTEVREQRSAIRSQRERVSRPDAKCFLSALCASAVKPISGFRLLISALCAALFALCVPVEAQQTKARPRIAVLSSRGGPLPTREGAFQEGLRKLGYVEG